MSAAFSVSVLIPLWLMFASGLLCAIAPHRVRKEFGGPLQSSGDTQIRVCGVLFMVAAAVFSCMAIEASVNIR